MRSSVASDWEWSFQSRGHAGGVAVADERHAVGAGLGDVAAAHREAAIVVVDEDGVAADLVDEAILQRAIFRAREEDGPAAVDGPVTAHQRLLVLHEGPRGVAEGQPLEGDEPHRGLLRAAELDKVPQADGFDGRLGQVNAGRAGR